MFFGTIGLILGVGGGLWSGHWLHRHYGRWGTATACCAFVAAICVVAWAQSLVGSNERIMAEESDSVAYRAEAPDHRPFHPSYSVVPTPAGSQCVTTVPGPNNAPMAISVPCGVTVGPNGGWTQTTGGSSTHPATTSTGVVSYEQF